MTKSKKRRADFFLGCAFAACLASAHAQPLPPHIGYVYPAGGRRGTAFEVTVGGQYLATTTNLIVSGAGIRAVAIEYARPLTQKEVNNLREKLAALQEKRRAATQNSQTDSPAKAQTSINAVWTDADQRALLEIRTRLASLNPKKPPNPAIAETATLRVALSADAVPGRRELRLAGPGGLSNPLMFCVGELAEFSKKPATATRQPEPGKPARRFRDESEGATPPTETAVTLPSVINGQILPGGVDLYRFRARQGQKLVAAASARQLIPYLADAVPGWFQAVLTLYDSKGKELAFADDFRFNPDPVLYCEIPRDGDYLLEIRDSIYRGREDFVYRIAVGELPFVTSIFPLGGQAGIQTEVELTGWNLPKTNIIMDASDKAPGVYPLLSECRAPSAEGESRGEGEVDVLKPRAGPQPETLGRFASALASTLFAVDSLPECQEREPNNSLANAQPVILPTIVNGRIGQPGDRDVFSFEGRAGQTVVAEVTARRLNSPLDSVLKLTDADGRQLAFNDDYEDKGAGLLTHQADSCLSATLPANGTYYIHLGDAQNQGGPEFGYRLRISEPRPDFALRVTPSSVNVRPGSTVPLTIYALRRDGFSNQIALVLEDAPAGFKLSGGLVPANQDQVRVTLTASSQAGFKPARLDIEGQATIAGQRIVHAAVPAEDMMQAFFYRHLVPAEALWVTVAGPMMPARAPRLLGEVPVRIPAGGTARIQLGLPTASGLANRLRFELSEPPDGITIQSIEGGADGREIVVRSDAAKVKPGLRGNLIVAASVERAQAAGKANAPATRQQRANMGVLPAIPFEIIAKD